MPKEIAQILKESRERVGLSQSALAKRIGMTQAQVSRLESGERISPSFETVAKIANATGQSLDRIAAEAGLLGDIAQVRLKASELRSMAQRASSARATLKKLDQELQDLAGRLDPDQKS